MYSCTLTKRCLLKVCDSLLNIGPCGQVAMGEPAFLSEAFNSSIPDPDIELVTTAGHGKNGALCLLQQSVRPQVRLELEYFNLFEGYGNVNSVYILITT